MSSYLYSLYDTVHIRGSNVGVGTTMPTELLHVENGPIYVEGLTNRNSNIGFGYSVINNVQEVRTDGLSALSSSTINVFANQLSNVDVLSVGSITTDGDAVTFTSKSLSNITDVHVSRNLYASNLYVVGEFTTLDTITSNTEQMTITNAGSGPAMIVTQTGTEHVAAFYDDNNMAMVVADECKVGINTSAPVQRLHVYDASGPVFAYVQTDSSSNAQLQLTNTGGSTYIGPASDGTIAFLSDANQSMALGTNSSNNTLVLLPDGNVGVGTASAAYKLDVSGKARVADSLYLTQGNMNTITFSSGKNSYTSTGAGSIGVRLAWTNVTTDNKLAFRVSIKCHLASDSDVAYRKFESLITPANDNDKPKEVTASEVTDTSNGKFEDLSHTVTRNDQQSVDLLIQWSAVDQPYLANLQVEVFAATDLGDFTFTPLP